MSALTTQQERDLGHKLARLQAIDAEICVQIDALIDAALRGEVKP